MREMGERNTYDVAILGAGLAGLTLARHLLLETDRTVLLVEKRTEIPPERQKVGESLVQLAGHYFGKVLDLEEYLLSDHFMKYNLRFHWPSSGAGSGFEDYHQSYIRGVSNVASYQLDRNRLEAELLRRNRELSRFELVTGATGFEVDLARDEAPHRMVFETASGRREAAARWFVDCTGRSRFLARRMDLTRSNPIDHGSFFWWVDGLIDVERLSDQTPRERRLDPRRRRQGHLPAWLATNHFVGEGFWFWVIPLRGKTSLGLVFDAATIDPSDVFSVEKATRWICERFPLLARDLPHREVLDFGGFRRFSYDCAQTISPERWAMTGESGRFSDPLYSPGGDLMAVHNTLIVAAVETEDPEELASRCRQSEQLMRSVYGAYLPSYAECYDALGDQEVFSLKYVWELSIYFAFYVFPFLNELLTDRRFGLAFLRLFSRLGPTNQGLQRFLSDFYRWKRSSSREGPPAPREPVLFDFMEVGTLRQAEATFYRVGIPVEEAKRVLTEQVENLEELARFVVAHAASVVLGERRVRSDRGFVQGIDLGAIRFDPEDFAVRWAACEERNRSAPPTETEPYAWSFDPTVLDRFRAAPESAGAETTATQEVHS